MAAVKLQRGSEEFQMFQDYWKLLQENWYVDDTDEYWEKVIADSKAFWHKYQTAFAKDLAVAGITELERRSSPSEI